MKNKILKISVIAIILFSIITILTGCESTYNNANNEIQDETDRFVTFKEWQNERYFTCYLKYDRETKVVYYIEYGSYTYGITVLLNSDGKPLLYEEDK